MFFNSLCMLGRCRGHIVFRVKLSISVFRKIGLRLNKVKNGDTLVVSLFCEFSAISANGSSET